MSGVARARLPKRRFALLIAAGASLAAAGAVAGDLTVVSWGGAYTKSQEEAYYKPWMARTGHRILSEDYSGGLSEVKAQVEAGNVSWDIVDVEDAEAILGCDEGLLEELDPAFLPAAPDGTSSTRHCRRACRPAGIVAWAASQGSSSSRLTSWPSIGVSTMLVARIALAAPVGTGSVP